MSNEQIPQQEEAISAAVVKKTLELMTTAFSLVAALAWNDAVQTLFQKIFGQASSVIAKFIYAIILTIIIVWMGVKLAKLNKVLEKKLNGSKSSSANGEPSVK